ncbi:protein DETOXIFICATION 14-like [Vigna unguiculata]|uniref:protein DETOXIFICATION 14-like n=1 Tax=Vigna unguiculata TaxID=3917 RepID=UPI001016A488|nr:protein DETOXIFICATION 14-like [Vigna unguiculata]
MTVLLFVSALTRRNFSMTLRENMKKGLLEKKREVEEGGSGVIRWSVFGEEVKRVAYLAAPMVAVTLSQYFLQIISMMMVGRLGKLELSSTAIAISLCNVSGLSVIFGMSCALETRCGQAYGARQYRKFGVQIYTAIVSLALVCLPLTFLWMNMGNLLVLLGQDHLVSLEAGKFALCMIPALFAYAALQSVVRFFLMQSLMSPLVMSSFITLCFHVAFSWYMVFKSGLGNLGAAFSIGTSYWLNVTLLGLYMKFSSQCEKTRVPISMELFHGIGEFICYAIPSAGMICLEWWSLEILILLSGLLPNPKLETSVLSVCLNISATIYTIPESIGSAASARVSNELGAGSPQSAKVSAYASMILAASQAIVMGSVIFSCRQILGYAFSNEQDVVDYVSEMVPLLSLSVLLDCLHGTLSGIARGCGWQHLGAYVNLGAYYALGIPISAMLGFWFQFRGKGLWIGILTGAFCQTAMLLLITLCTNWKKQAIEARENIFQRSFSVEDGLA